MFDKLCAGKGCNPAQARASALCEALERSSGVYQGDEYRARASLRALGTRAVHFNELQNFSDRQFAHRAENNARYSDPRQWVPEPFDPEAEIDWTPAFPLNGAEARYVPLSYCYAEVPREAGRRFGMHNPNGAAAGNCLEEAILQGLLELVERDATAIWWYNRLSMRSVDISSFKNSYFDVLMEEYKTLGYEMWILFLEHDIAVPTCVALARHTQQNRYLIGFGCHLSAKLAVQRALTEMNQLFDTTSKRQAPWDMERLPSVDFLLPRPGAPPFEAEALPHVSSTSLKEDIEYCVSALASRGLEVMMVDKTRPDIGLSVVQVIAPGMRHFWPRLGPGRLYEVPVSLGLRKRPLSEDEINPVALFL